MWETSVHPFPYGNSFHPIANFAVGAVSNLQTRKLSSGEVTQLTTVPAAEGSQEFDRAAAKLPDLETRRQTARPAARGLRRAVIRFGLGPGFRAVSPCSKEFRGLR